MSFKPLHAIVFLAFISACTPYKSVPYFQDLKKDKITEESISNYSPLTIQPGDLLALHVTSLNHEADAPFNYTLGTITPNSPPGVDRQEQEEVAGYPVDEAGDIHLPFIGAVKVKDLTTNEIATLLQTKLADYTMQPSVNVRIKNFKVSVMGDVAHPGVFGSKDERLTITEAITMAGDLNTTGIRDSVLLIREIGGKRQFIPMNLTSRKIFESPFYYLKNNDVIYVQPNKDRVAQSDSGVAKASIVIGALSVLALILTRIL